MFVRTSDLQFFRKIGRITLGCVVHPILYRWRMTTDDRCYLLYWRIRANKLITLPSHGRTCTCTCDVMDFSRLSLYCPYPVVFQWASRRFLNELTEVAPTTCWGRLFQALITLWLKKFFLRSRRDLLTDSLRLWPRRPCVLSERWKNWCGSIFSFLVKIL